MTPATDAASSPAARPDSPAARPESPPTGSPALEQLTGPGGPFEIVRADVLGYEIQVYKDRMRSLRELIAAADARADVAFLVQGDRRLTYGEHNAAVRRVAQRFVELGLEPGDRIALLTANTVEWVVLFWAAAAIGAVIVPLNAWWKTEELEFGLRDSGAKLLFCDPKRWTVVRDLPAALPDLAHVFVKDLDAPDGAARPGTELFAGDDPGALPAVAVAEDDVLAILYTSGTTGTPKGATITHRQALANLQNIFCSAIAQASQGAAPPELGSPYQSATLLVVPLFHVTGCLATMTLCYATGAKLVLMPPGRFDASAAMATIERERVTTIGGVPTIMWRIVEAPDFEQYDLTSVSRISYGGAPAAPELVTRIQERFPAARRTLATAYGLTETASIATAIVGDDYTSHPGSVGRPVPTVEIAIVDAADDQVARGESGEIWVRGPTVMLRGYWHRPDATAAAITPEGWFRSGDIGRFDDDGFLYLVDRAKDMIIRAGENIYCVEVEHALFEHPDVLDVAVVGVPHRELGEEVKAFVQLRAGTAVVAVDLREFATVRLADFKVPAHWELRDAPLPRNPAGKILKSILRGDTAAFAASDDSAL